MDYFPRLVVNFEVYGKAPDKRGFQSNHGNYLRQTVGNGNKGHIPVLVRSSIMSLMT
jgi:hypothetical protein